MSLQYSKKSDNHYVIDPNCTDDHSDSTVDGSIQWALDQLPVTGGTIELVSGNYNVSDTDTILFGTPYTEIVGIGPSSIITIDQTSGTRPYDTIYNEGHEHCAVRNLSVSGGVTVQPWTNYGEPIIHADTSAHYFTVENISTYNVTGLMVDIGGSDYGKILNCMFDSLGICMLVLYNADEAQVIGNTFVHYGNQIGGIDDQDHCIYSPYTDSTIILDNILICRNIDGSVTYPIRKALGADGNIIVGNTFWTRQGGQQSNDGIITISQSNDNLIAMNQCYKGSNGVSLVDGSLRNLIADNLIRVAWADGIEIEGWSNDNAVPYNSIREYATNRVDDNASGTLGKTEIVGPAWPA